MIEMCLEVLLSGVISTNIKNDMINYNNNVTYNIAGKNVYVLPDKYNLMLLCDNENQRFANINIEKQEIFNIVSSIE